MALALPAWLTTAGALIALGIAALGLMVVVIVLSQRLAATRRHQDERENTLTKFSSAVMNSGAMILITDAEGRIEFVNERFCQLTGFSPEQMIGESVASLSATVNLAGTETGVLTNFLD